MSIRKHPTMGDGYWYIEYWPEGKKRDPETKKVVSKRETLLYEGTYEGACLWEKELRRKAGAPPPVTSAIRDCVPDFLFYYKANRAASNVDRFIGAWERNLAPHFGHLKWSQLTQGIVETYKVKRLAQTYDRGKKRKEGEAKPQPVSKRTIHLELSYLSTLWKWAAKNGWCNSPHFKIEGFEAKQTKAPLPVVPTREEVQRIFDAMEDGDPRKEIFLVMYHGGLRRTEAYTLRAEKVLIEHELMFVTGKGGKERIVPIHPEVFELLKARVKKVKKGYLFTSNRKKGEPFKDLKKYLAAAVEKAGVDKRIHQHLLRHGFGAHGTESGITLRALQTMMGHSSSKTTELYTQIAGDFIKAEMSKFGGPKRTEEEKEKGPRKKP